MRRCFFAVMAVSLGAFALSACATLTAEQCTTANWQQLGYQDAVSGHTPDRLAQHFDACTEHGITPDQTLYEMGHSEGARVYCDPENAFRLGVAGTAPAPICPADMAVIFNDNHAAGFGLFERRRAVNESRNAMVRAERAIEDLERYSADLENELAFQNPTPERRNTIVIELEDNRTERRRIRDDLRRFRSDLRTHERELDTYKARLEFVVMEPGF
ncbi:DUF2799 domain-containing protein [Pyruvatibacter sp.]|uniref:DUF2799 domain-containing protein n=1 Tax=Pyruvatibacter sp. TaxID=1981328 RepID=UPI0032EDE602